MFTTAIQKDKSKPEYAVLVHDKIYSRDKLYKNNLLKLSFNLEGTRSKADFEDKKAAFFSPESVASCDMNDPDKSYFSDKLQKIDFPYFSFEILKLFSKKLKDKKVKLKY